MNKRTESDSLGKREIDSESYIGINTLRAYENFALSSPYTNIKIIKELSLVKKCAAMANCECGYLPKDKRDAILQSCDEIYSGAFDEYFITNSLQGGAGTSTNMNVNEVIANRANELLGAKKGDYSIVHPLNDVNMSQSTNDVYPTAVRIVAIKLIRELATSLSVLQSALQEKETQLSDIPKLGRTELMDALPMSTGQGFGAYAQAIGRDRWRIYKGEERLRQINLGGTAIGTGLGASLKYIYLITQYVGELSGLGLCRAESPMDITQNADVFVEVSGLLKACASSLIKICGDLRLLSSGPSGGFGEINLPQLQAGSTIMPGKVNPVIPEMLTQVCIRVIANDTAITQAAFLGQLELNAFLPLIADSLLNSLELLNDGIKLFTERCIKGITVNSEKMLLNLESSQALSAVLINKIGYDKAADIAKRAANEKKSVKEIAVDEGIFSKEEAEDFFSIGKMTRPNRD